MGQCALAEAEGFEQAEPGGRRQGGSRGGRRDEAIGGAVWHELAGQEGAQRAQVALVQQEVGPHAPAGPEVHSHPDTPHRRRVVSDEETCARRRQRKQRALEYEVYYVVVMQNKGKKKRGGMGDLRNRCARCRRA